MLHLLVILLLQGIEAKDRCVLVTAEVRTAPPRIGLRWTADAKAVEYTVYRRAPSEPTWGTSRARVEAGGTGWDDDDVKAGEAYEYKVLKTAKAGDKVFEGTGYLHAGIELPLVEARGKVLLLVDRDNAKALDVELKRLVRDLEGDGWSVARRDVDPAAKAADVKALVKAEPGLRSVFLLGRIPVLRSGFMTPDGHPDHRGAWPADAYYGDLDGEWSDAAVDKPEGKNVPGDGKLDPSQLPGEVELEVGRVDLSRMPAFGKPEAELLRRYLDRNHAFRHRKMDVERRALICDQFGDFRGEAFVSGGWRNFSALVGASKIETGAWFEKLGAGSYLWAHGSGAGGWQSCAGVGTTADFAAKPAKAVFTSLFGSYFGDWDSENGLLRAPLAAEGYALASFWSGRPHWYAQALGLGEPLGAAARATQNNRGLYAPTGNFARGVHVSLMGDPTLRIHPVAPPGTPARGKGLTWTASADATSGYHVYRKDAAGWTRLTPSPIRETRWAEAAAASTYMIRAVKLESGPWGSYLNSSQGVLIN